MTRRRLTAEEIELWRKVVETTERLHPEAKPPARPPLPKPKPVKPPHAHPALAEEILPFELGQAARGTPRGHDLKPSISDHLHRAPVAMDHKLFTRMKRGKLAPEARLDLHGMRVEAAHASLIRFILTSQAAGRRLVLVITGKGKRDDTMGPIPSPRGVLRNQVPHWLDLPPMAQAVLQVTPAHLSHGGGGAYYVYLRRGR